MRERAFGNLIVNGTDGPLTSSIPALLSIDGTRLEFHLVRSNPICSVIENAAIAVFLVNGPDSYVSPDWYGLEDQVPTWNYVAVRIKGTVCKLDDNDLRPVLDRLSAHLEDQLLPKQPWQADKMKESALLRMMRTITPYALQVKSIEGTWKLNQNKPDEVQQRAATKIEQSGIGLSPTSISSLMKDKRVMK